MNPIKLKYLKPPSSLISNIGSTNTFIISKMTKEYLISKDLALSIKERSYSIIGINVVRLN